LARVGHTQRKERDWGMKKERAWVKDAKKNGKVISGGEGKRWR